MAKKSSRSSKASKKSKQLTKAQQEKADKRSEDRAKREEAEAMQQATIEHGKQAGEQFVQQFKARLSQLSSPQEKETYLSSQLLEQLKTKKIIAWQQGMLHAITLENSDSEAQANRVRTLLLEAFYKVPFYLGRSLAFEGISFKDCAGDVINKAVKKFPTRAQEFSKLSSHLKKLAETNRDSSWFLYFDRQDIATLRFEGGNYRNRAFEEDEKYYRYYFSPEQIQLLEGKEGVGERFVFIAMPPAYIFDRRKNEVKLARGYFNSLQTEAQILLPTVYSGPQESVEFKLAIPSIAVFRSGSKWLECSAVQIPSRELQLAGAPPGANRAERVKAAEVMRRVDGAVEGLVKAGLSTLDRVDLITALLNDRLISPIGIQLKQLDAFAKIIQVAVQSTDVASASAVSFEEFQAQQTAAEVAWKTGADAINIATGVMVRLKDQLSTYLCALHLAGNSLGMRGVLEGLIKNISDHVEKFFLHQKTFKGQLAQVQASFSESKLKPKPMEFDVLNESTLRMSQLPREFIGALACGNVDEWARLFWEFCDYYCNEFSKLVTGLINSVVVATRYLSPEVLETFRGQASHKKLLDFFREDDKKFQAKRLASYRNFFENYAKPDGNGFDMPVYWYDLQKVIESPVQLNYGICRDAAFYGLLPADIVEVFRAKRGYELYPVKKCYWLDENSQFNISSQYLKEMYRLYSDQECLFFPLGEAIYSISLQQITAKLETQEGEAEKEAPVRLEVDLVEHVRQLTGALINTDRLDAYVLAAQLLDQEASDAKIGRSVGDATHREQHAKVSEGSSKAPPSLVKKKTAEEKAASLAAEEELRRTLEEQALQEAMKRASEYLRQLAKILPEGSVEFLDNSEQEAKTPLRELAKLRGKFVFDTDLEGQCQIIQNRYDQCRCNKYADGAVAYLTGDEGRSLNASHYENAVKQARLCLGLKGGASVKGNLLELTANNAFLVLKNSLLNNIHQKYEKIILGVLPHAIAYLCRQADFEKARDFCSTLNGSKNSWEALRDAVKTQQAKIQEASAEYEHQKAVDQLKQDISDFQEALDSDLNGWGLGECAFAEKKLSTLRAKASKLGLGFSLASQLGSVGESITEFKVQEEASAAERRNVLKVLAEEAVLEQLDRALKGFLTKPLSRSKSKDEVEAQRREVYAPALRNIAAVLGEDENFKDVKKTTPLFMLPKLVQWCEEHFNSHEQAVLKLMGAVSALAGRSSRYARYVAEEVMRLKREVRDRNFIAWVNALLTDELRVQVINAEWLHFFDRHKADLVDCMDEVTFSVPAEVEVFDSKVEPSDPVKIIKQLHASLKEVDEELFVMMKCAVSGNASDAELEFFMKIFEEITGLLEQLVEFKKVVPANDPALMALLDKVDFILYRLKSCFINALKGLPVFPVVYGVFADIKSQLEAEFSVLPKDLASLDGKAVGRIEALLGSAREKRSQCDAWLSVYGSSTNKLTQEYVERMRGELKNYQLIFECNASTPDNLRKILDSEFFVFEKNEAKGVVAEETADRGSPQPLPLPEKGALDTRAAFFAELSAKDDTAWPALRGSARLVRER